MSVELMIGQMVMGLIRIQSRCGGNDDVTKQVP